MLTLISVETLMDIAIANKEWHSLAALMDRLASRFIINSYDHVKARKLFNIYLGKLPIEAINICAEHTEHKELKKIYFNVYNLLQS